MECISTSFAPIIVQPESSGQDWAQQHILGEQIHLGQTKQQQPPSSSPRSPSFSFNTTTNNNNNIAAGFHKTQWSPRQGAGRHRNHAHTNTLQIPTHNTAGAGRGGPALKTPVKLDERSRDDWEALLTSSIASLQGAYSRLHVHQEPPPAPRRRPSSFGERSDTDQPDVAGLDRAEVASRALQAAAGCHVMFPAQAPMAAMMMMLDDDESGSDAGSSSASEESDEAPATPCEVMEIDPRLFS